MIHQMHEMNDKWVDEELREEGREECGGGRKKKRRNLPGEKYLYPGGEIARVFSTSAILASARKNPYRKQIFPSATTAIDWIRPVYHAACPLGLPFTIMKH